MLYQLKYSYVMSHSKKVHLQALIKPDNTIQSLNSPYWLLQMKNMHFYYNLIRKKHSAEKHGDLYNHTYFSIIKSKWSVSFCAKRKEDENRDQMLQTIYVD